MRHSGAIVEGSGSAVAPAFGGRARYRGFRRGVRRGSSRTGASTRFSTKWRPQPRAAESPLDRAVPLALAFAAAIVWVMCGFRYGAPGNVAVVTVFAAFSSVVQVALLVAGAYFTAAITAGGFGDLRAAVVKFAAIVLATMAVGALLGGLAGNVAAVVLFLALVVYLFDVELLDAAILWGLGTTFFTVFSLAAAFGA